MTRPSDPLWTAIMRACNGCRDVASHRAEILAAVESLRTENAELRSALSGAARDLAEVRAMVEMRMAALLDDADSA